MKKITLINFIFLALGSQMLNGDCIKLGHYPASQKAKCENNGHHICNYQTVTWTSPRYKNPYKDELHYPKSYCDARAVSSYIALYPGTSNDQAFTRAKKCTLTSKDFSTKCYVRGGLTKKGQKLGQNLAKLLQGMYNANTGQAAKHANLSKTAPKIKTTFSGGRRKQR